MHQLSTELKNLIEKRDLLPAEFIGTYWHQDKQDADKEILNWVLKNSRALINSLEYIEEHLNT